MSTGGTGGHPVGGLNYGSWAAQQHVDTADDLDPIGRAAGYTGTGTQHKDDKSLMSSLKEALKPGDLKKSSINTEDTTHDGRHGGIAETMKPGHRDYDKREEHKGGVMNTLRSGLGNSASHRDATSSSGGGLSSVLPGRQDHSNKERGGGLLDILKPGGRRGDEARGQKASGSFDSLNPGDSTPNISQTFKAGAGGDPGSVGQQLRGGSGAGPGMNYKYDMSPATEDYIGSSDKRESKLSGDVDNQTVPRTSPFDSRGAIGQQFTSEGAVGGTADKIGGPFSTEGVIGRHFTDSGALGGTVQDKLGHGDSTRKGK